MLKSLPDVFRSFWSKQTNDNPPHAAGRKRKREEIEWEEDPDVQIVKVEKRRKTDSFWNWNIFNFPSKMADWIRLKNRPFSEQFTTSKASSRSVKETKRNGASSRIPQVNGSQEPDPLVYTSRVDGRLGFQNHSRGIPNGEASDCSQNTSRLSDRASSTNTYTRPSKNSTSSMCIRLNEKEQYQKLLKMQMIHSRLASSNSWNVSSVPVESDMLSISSNNSSDDVSLLGTSQCLSQIKHSRRDPLPPSIPQYKTTPRKTLALTAASSPRVRPRVKPTDIISGSFSSLIARQKKRTGLAHQSQSQSEKNVSKPSFEAQKSVTTDNDDGSVICIIDDEEDDAKADTKPKPSSQDNDHSSQTIASSSNASKATGLSFMDSVYTRDGYLQELQKSRLMHSEQWKRQVEDEEMKAKAYEEKRRAQSIELERRLKHQMRIFESEPEVSEEIFVEEESEPEEDEEEEDSLPDLTDSMMDIVTAAMRPNPPGEVLSDGYSLKITRRDVATLGGLNWLNDEIINFYMNMLIDRGKQENMPNVYAFNTFFYPKIMSGGHAAVKRWTKKVDIFAMHYILIPVHLGMHWCLCIADMKDKVITYYDSMGARNDPCLKVVLKYINDESVAKKQKPINESEWDLVTATDNPQQMNGGDCGMFTCKYAEYITRGKKISFTQNDMPYFRLRMVYEIVTKKLLQ